MASNVTFHGVEDAPPLGASAAKPIPPPVQIPEPPATLDEPESLALILAGKRRVYPTSWPTEPSVRVGLQLLGRGEMSTALSQADMDAKLLGNGEARPGVADRCFRDHVVQMALVQWPPPRNPEHPPEVLIASVEELRGKLREADIEALFEQYARLEKWAAPLQRAEFEGNPGLFKEILNSLGKEPGSPLLTLLPREVLETLVRHLASQAREP